MTTLTASQREFLTGLQVLCEKHGASIFFGDHPADLWMHGDRAGLLRDSESGDGSRFEIADEDFDGNALESARHE